MTRSSGIDRRGWIAGSTALLGTTAVAARMPAAPAASPCVTRQGMALQRRGGRYRFVGANMWYAAWLGSDSGFGDRNRLVRELDRLAALGITNIRLLASAELSPLKNSIVPTFRDRSDHYNETLIAGLDWTLAEMAKRDMTAVLYLTNFWEWSGGMMTYLYWVNGGRYINMNDPAHPWPEFADWNADFYADAAAQALYRDYVRALVTRTNSVTGTAYAADPTIMAWQLANEPRPGGSPTVAEPHLPAFYQWIDATARYIKALDPHHLVCTGSEGLQGSLGRGDIVLHAHRSPAIDYLTTHIWPNNWGWIEAHDLAGSYDRGAAKVADYIDAHRRIARQLGKPLVIEEFGYPRDGAEAYDPAITTHFRDRFYRQIYAAVEADMEIGGPLAGSNLWAWNGEARTVHPDFRFQPGDRAYMGDPPHEPQGWYGVFDQDRSTQAIIRRHADSVRSLGEHASGTPHGSAR